MNLTDGLNDAQKTAVTAQIGPVLVLAGPGSGKTRVLTHRIAYLIQELKIAPWHIMAVTFTNKASKEMKERLEKLLGGQPRGLLMGTFHSSCVRILRREVENLTHYDRNFVIFDSADQLQVVKQALKDLNLDDKKFPPRRILNGISNAKNELITPDLYAATNYIAEVTKRVYTQYQALLYANNAMDFDDLLMNTVLLFDERADVLTQYQERYQHILVDEFQDTNTAQYRLLRMLAAGGGNIFAVGDADQSIYKWRGADFRNIQRFREQYPTAQQILLEQNYRSTQIILDAAKAVIKHNPMRVHKELFTERQGGERIELSEAYNEYEEAQFVTDGIDSLMLQGYNGNEIGVMYRTNAQSRVLEEAFLRKGMSYRVVGATEFYRRREIKDVIAYLRLIHNLADSVSFGRVVNTPPRGVGLKTRQTLEKWAAENGWQPAVALINLVSDREIVHPFNGRSLNALGRIGHLLRAWTTLREHASVPELLDAILEQISYRNYLDDGTREGEDRWANVMEFHNVAAEDSSLPLGDFLEQIALVSETDNLDDTANTVTMLTLHAAKGLEFPIVFLTGLEDGVLPHSRSLDDAEELAEERRLFYVGLTRAKDRLFISHAFRRTFFGESSVAVPSRFLRDIPATLTEGGTMTKRREQSKTRASRWSSGGTGASSKTRWSSSSSSSSTKRRASSSGRQTSKRGKRPSRTQHQTPPKTSNRQPKPKLRVTPRHLQEEFEPEITETPKQTAPQYQSGQRIRHAKFGEGTVIECKSVGNDQEVTVAFPDIGIKRLAASFAKLEILD